MKHSPAAPGLAVVGHFPVSVGSPGASNTFTISARTLGSMGSGTRRVGGTAACTASGGRAYFPHVPQHQNAPSLRAASHPGGSPRLRLAVRAQLTGLKSFSKANKAACEHAVNHITAITLDLFDRLVVHGPPRTREVERQKAIERGKKREQQLRERVLREIG